MKSLKTLPPRHNSEHFNKKNLETRRGSKLLKMQANFQAKQLEEKEEKLINILEDKQKRNIENIKLCIDAKNSYCISNTSISNDSFFENGFSKVCESIKEKKKEASPVGWDKSYPLRPVEIDLALAKRAKSLERNNFNKKSYNKKNFGLLMRTQSQTFVCSSSEDSYTSSRPQSGFDYNRDSNDSYIVCLSSDESPIYDSHSQKRDYSKPLPPSYRNNPRKNLYNYGAHCDSAYSSHSSDRREEHAVSRKLSLSTHSFRTSIENENKINSQTYKKHKSPAKKRDEFVMKRPDIRENESFDLQTKIRISERQREEDKRRMQIEMRKREQELLAKIKDQQRELEVIKAEKIEVEKALLGTKAKQNKHSTYNTKNDKKEENKWNPKLNEKKKMHRPIIRKKHEEIPTQTRRSVFAPKPRNDLVQCKNCDRNFAEDRIEKHESICDKTFNKIRKKFDMKKARVKGTDAAAYQKNQNQANKKYQSMQKKSDWRKKRAEFHEALKSAKLAQKHIAAGGNLKDLPPPPISDTSDYLQCPYCTRRFSQAVSERHIPKCKDIKCNKRK